MGGSSHSLPRFSWDFVRKDDWHQIYQNENGDLAEKHLIENDPKLHEDQELETYFYRYRSNKPLIKIYRADYDKADMCSNHRNITVFTEYIPYRLIDVSNLSHHQGLYVLSEALIGFYELYGRLGPFAVDDTLIGFNMDGKCKVWYNPEFAKNHFTKDTIILVSTRNPQEFDQRMDYRMESEMVTYIWDAVCKHSLFRGDFMAKVNSLDPLTFRALKEVTDNQIRSCDYVPPALRFEDRYGIISSSRAKIASSKDMFRLGGRMRNNRTSLQSDNRVSNREVVEQRQAQVNRQEVRRENQIEYRPLNQVRQSGTYQNRTQGNTMNSYVVYENRTSNVNRPPPQQSSIFRELNQGSGANRVRNNYRSSNTENSNLNRTSLQEPSQGESLDRGNPELVTKKDSTGQYENNQTIIRQSSNYSNGRYENNREMIVN